MEYREKATKMQTKLTTSKKFYSIQKNKVNIDNLMVKKIAYLQKATVLNSQGLEKKL